MAVDTIIPITTTKTATTKTNHNGNRILNLSVYNKRRIGETKHEMMLFCSCLQFNYNKKQKNIFLNNITFQPNFI